MEYIMINESKLKVMLESSELQSRNLDANELDYADPYAKRLFGDILCYAKDNFDFDTSGYRVLLQLYPSKDGGCELFITRLGRLDKDTDDEASVCEKKKKDTGRENRSKKRKNQKAFRFEHLSDLLKVCRRLRESDIECSGSVFVDRDGIWFLILSVDDPLYDDIYDVLPINDFSFIFEYGSPENHVALSMYLCEHARAVSTDDAIETLGKI